MLQIEARQEFVGAGIDRGPRELPEHAHHLQVLATGEVGVDRRELARHADPTADGVGVLHDVTTQHLGPSGIGLEHGGQHPHGGGLAGAVGTEQAEHGPFRHLEIDAVEGDDVVEPLLEAFHDDRVVTHAREVPTCT